MSAAGLKDAGLLKAELKYGIPLSSSVTRLPGPDGVGIAPLPPTPGQDIQRPQLGIYIYISVAGRPPPSQTSRMWPMRAADAFDQSKYEYIGRGCAECCRPEPRDAVRSRDAGLWDRGRRQIHQMGNNQVSELPFPTPR